MATKKPSKNVIDYDPLAWLNDDGEEASENASTTAPKKKKVKKKVAKKKASSKKKAAKVSQEQDQAIAETIDKISDEADAEENSAYGFFSDEGQEQEKATPESEEPAAFGFFDEDEARAEPDIVEKTESVTEPDEATAYGFFNESDTLTTQAAERDSDSNVINLGAELTIRSVGVCKDLINQSLSNGFDVRIAAGELQKIDSAGLQLIYSLKTTLEKTAQSIHWESTSHIINDAAKIIGMPRLCEGDDADPGYGFFADDNVSTPSTADSANDGYGFF